MTEVSEVKRFYDGLNILITGATGFMGKILVEKLLRSTDVATIYLLVREKKGKTALSRIDDLLSDVVFKQLEAEQPKFKHRIVGIPGDCSTTGLGITINDRQKLINEVNVIFHVAATVRFHENIKSAFTANVNSVRYILELGRQMRNLKSLIHVSTAYSNCARDHIDEVFYDCPVHYETTGNLLEEISEQEAEQLTPSLIGKWPNTYTFTKAMAESLIKNVADGLPVGIFRPAVVISTYKEPIPGWTDNIYGPMGVCAAACMGLLRVALCDRNAIADLVPADTCVAALIVAAWDVASKPNLERTSSNTPIYNYVSSVENSLTWNEFTCMSLLYDGEYPLSNCKWPTIFHTTTDGTHYTILKIIFHFIPGFFVDLVNLVRGRKPESWKIYRKIHKFSEVVGFFSTREWKFSNNNVQMLWSKMNETDRKLFPLSITKVLWMTYFRNFMKGLRLYVFKDPLENIDCARIKRRRMNMVHEFFKFFIQLAVVLFIWSVFRQISNVFSGSDVNQPPIIPNNNTCINFL